MSNSTEKVLVIRKPDRSIHQTNLRNSAAMKAYSNRLPAALQWKFEVMDKAEADKLPAIDPHYVSAANASSKVVELNKALENKDTEIETLRKQLAAFQNGTANGSASVVKAAEISPEINSDSISATNSDTVSGDGSGKALPIAVSQPAAKPLATAIPENSKKRGGQPGPKKP